MAITEAELNISNQSYTNKDFDAVYTELLTLAKQISYRYDPTASNESDPFIVLLKLLAFVTDKVNYQIDKNILERFMPSATQESSMRDLTSRLGYNMHYYKGAQTKVVYKYKFPSGWDSGDITVPAFTSIVKASVDSSITYIPLQDGRIDQATGMSQAVDVIQGTYKTLSVLDNTTIQLENLDEQKRLYFPETMVAENGVFISGGSISEIFPDGWVVTNNLNSEQYGCPCYFFGFDSNRGLPYIQFPDWISVIIGEGLTIHYIVTQGSIGNVRAKALDTVDFSVAEGSSYEASDISVVNTSGATNGADPETIDEAYNGFKKTIGTFDTLVTCRDYANFIYNLLDDTGNNYVSNVQVSDRRTDINYSMNVAEFEGVEITESEASNSDITPYDLCIYPFKPVSMATVSALSSILAYKESFTLLESTAAIKNALSDEKVLVHTYKALNSTAENPDIFCIKNYYELNAVISTTTKVDLLEQANILINVNGALATKFYSHNLDFGYEIPYDELLKCIETADSRIKSVSLFEPNQTPKALMCNGSEIGITNSDGTGVSDWFKVIAIKNIVSGRVALFDYDTVISYNYDKNRDETVTTKHPKADSYDLIDKVEKVTTKANIPTIAAGSLYSLLANEVIQFIAPNYIDQCIYPYGVNYYLELEGDTSTSNSMSIISWTAEDYKLTIKFSGESTNREIVALAVSSGSTTIHQTDWANPEKAQLVQEFLSSANGMYCFTVQKIDTSSYTYNFPSGTNNFIPKGTEYQLRQNDKFIVEYTEDEVLKFVSYSATSKFDGKLTNIIKPNFDMYTNKFRASKRAAYVKGETALEFTNPEDGLTLKYYTLTTNQEVAARQINQEIIEDTRKYYWDVAETNNEIYWTTVSDNSFEYVLKENESIFVTDMNNTSLYQYGSGTRFMVTKALKDTYLHWTCNRIQDLSQLTDEGIAGFGNYFKTVPATNNNPLTIQELQIVTLTTNDILKNVGSTDLSINNNVFSNVQDATIIKYKFESEEEFQSLPPLANQKDKWRARGLLDINAGPNMIQSLCGLQSITVTYYGGGSTGRSQTYGNDPDETNKWSFQFDSLKQMYGGENLLLYTTDTYTGEITYPTIYLYKLDTDVTTRITSSNTSNYDNLIFKADDPTKPISPVNPASVVTYLPQIKSGKFFDPAAALPTAIAKDVYVMVYTTGRVKDESVSSNSTRAFISYQKNLSYKEKNFSELFTPYNLNNLSLVFLHKIKVTGKDANNHNFTANFNLWAPSSYNTAITSFETLAKAIVECKYIGASKISATGNVDTTLTIAYMNAAGSKLSNYYIYFYDKDKQQLGDGVNKDCTITIVDTISTDPTYEILDLMIVLKTNGVKQFKFTIDSEDVNILLSLPRVVNGINPLLGLLANDLIVQQDPQDPSVNPKKLTAFEQEMVTKYGGYDGAFKKFYATTFVDTVKDIELSDTYKLTNAHAFYDVNNIANKWTIPQIDFSTAKTVISIAKSSQK